MEIETQIELTIQLDFKNMCKLTSANLISTILLVLICGCSVTSKVSYEGGLNEAINKSINDFSSTKSFRRGAAFEVSFMENYYVFSLTKKSDGTYAWLPDKSYPEIYGVSILRGSTKFAYDPSDIGKVSKTVPSVVTKKNDKLFYWWDDGTTLTKKTVDTLSEFGLIDDSNETLNYSNDDSQKAMHYYFCKNDLSRHRRVYSDKALGYYAPPNLNCAK